MPKQIKKVKAKGSKGTRKDGNEIDKRSPSGKPHAN